MTEFTPEQLAEMRRLIAKTNGQKGGIARWAKYPPGSPERLAQLAQLRQYTKKKKPLDSPQS